MADHPETKVSRKPALVLVAIIGVLALATIWFCTGPNTQPAIPKFIPCHIPATNSYSWENFNAYDMAPCRDGKLWVTVRLSNTNFFPRYLYDLRNREIIGQTTNCSPIFSNGDQTKLLCESWDEDTSLSGTVINEVSAFLSKIRVLRYKPGYRENFLVLDIRNNTTKRLGGFSQLAGCGSRWVASPTFRFGFNLPSSEWTTLRAYVCDLESAELKKIDCPGQPHGWWDSDNILCVSGNNITLFDVVTGTKSNLFTHDQIKSFLTQNNLPDCQLTAFSKWNGSSVDNYFAPEYQRNGGQGFLLKADHTGRTLKLIDRNFEFHWLGYLDPNDRYYIFPGELGKSGRGGDGSIRLRDLRDNSVRTLIPSTGIGYSVARFCDDSILYVKNGRLWHMDLTGSNNVPLFGPTNTTSNPL